jgi:NAD(P)-dependent dehydrogenase (short-subunit alcohol dehydrogenase family)
MSQVRFDDHVAVVTGAGGGLGREYAILLAKRGAKVLVNDLGCNFLGEGSDKGYAQAVADEITAVGGIALANGDTVTTTEGAESIIRQAVSAWGKVDILINNAGLVRSSGSLDQVTDKDYDFDMSIAAGGTFRMTRAVWRMMRDRNYGRILNVASGSVFGMGSAVPYPATKMAVIGMTRSLAVAARDHNKNIKVNCILPAAYGRLSHLMGPEAEASMKRYFPVHSCAPVAAWLVHRDVPCNGEILTVGGGRFARVFIGVAQGYRGSKDITIEEVRDHFDEGMDITNFRVPTSTFEEVAMHTSEFEWGEFKQMMPC